MGVSPELEEAEAMGLGHIPGIPGGFKGNPEVATGVFPVGLAFTGVTPLGLGHASFGAFGGLSGSGGCLEPGFASDAAFAASG